MTPGIKMRLTASHRKAKVLKEQVPDAAFMFSWKRNWYYRVPESQVATARQLGLTVVRGEK